MLKNNKAIQMSVRMALVALLGYALVSHLHYLRANVSRRDSVAYWTAGRFLLHHSDPYDTAKVLDLERSLGYAESKPLVLRTPPWSLFMVLPLGAVSALWAWILWIGLSLGSLLLAMRLCWRMYGEPQANDISRNLFWLVGYTFAPIPACLVAGQMGIMLLLGIALFLWLEPRRPLLAGAALIFPFAKPHLLSLFWCVLVFWIFTRRRWAVAVGFFGALLIATSLALGFDPEIFQHYQGMLHQAAIGYEFIPALSGVLRLLFFRTHFWVQFIPMALGLLWCAWFCVRKRTAWDWRRDGPAVMVVAVLTTPYSWLTDEVVLLPAVLQAAVCILSVKQMSLKMRAAVATFAGLNGLLLLILYFKIPFSTGIYFWSSLVWFGWYFYGLGSCQPLQTQPK